MTKANDTMKIYIKNNKYMYVLRLNVVFSLKLLIFIFSLLNANINLLNTKT